MATTYLVLTKDDSGMWMEEDTVEAVSADTAIRAIAGLNNGGTFVAVPARSWKPRKVTVESTPRVKLS
jgi:hypothetical protein